jgi:hypothetical protein
LRCQRHAQLRLRLVHDLRSGSAGAAILDHHFDHHFDTIAVNS